MERADMPIERIGRDVAQPPSAVTTSNLPRAKPAKDAYRRNLPHVQQEDKTIFITFSTYKRWELPEAVRNLVIAHCLHDQDKKLLVHGIVVMPDHVHMVLSPLRDSNGNIYGLAEILSGIKGASAHSINKFLQRKGHVWQAESFDHILRSDEKIVSKVEYICDNPVRKKLVKTSDDYPWLWREWLEGKKVTAEGGCAT
jgi:REP element-mobilizing transposase RayT